MTLELINTEERATQASYTQVVVAAGSRLVFVAGQLADDAAGNLVGSGGDLAAHTLLSYAAGWITETW